jgi:hypothetical protein
VTIFGKHLAQNLQAYDFCQQFKQDQHSVQMADHFMLRCNYLCSHSLTLAAQGSVDVLGTTPQAGVAGSISDNVVVFFFQFT